MKNRTLSPLAIQRLKIIRAFILKEPELYDQSSVYPMSECGTPGCIFGWAVFLFGSTLKGCEGAAPLNRRGAVCIGFVDDVWSGYFENDYCSSNRLYADWTDDGDLAHLRQNKPYDRMTIRERAEFAARRIDHFIATDGAE